MGQMTIQQALTAAVAHHQAGRLREADALYRQVLSADPGNVDALHLLGVMATQVGQHAAAVELIRQAVARQPLATAPQYNLGCALQGCGRVTEAEACFRRAIELHPGYVEAHNNLGDVLRERMEYAEAEACFRRAIELSPDFPDGWTNLGVVLNRTRRQEEAIACHRRAIGLRPGFATAHNNLGNVLMDCGYVAEAVVSFRRALAIEPAHAAIQSNLLLTLFYEPARDPATHFQEHQQWNERWARPLRRETVSWRNNPDPDRRLRVGYISPDFYDHSVRFFFEGLLSHHHAERVETFCYANVFRRDAVTQRLKASAHHWRDITEMSDDAAAAKIQADEIDILVDLAGHTAGNRIRIFAQKPAPIQVSYLGFLGSTGLETIDYRLTDRFVDPEGAGDALYVEELIRLPRTFACFCPAEHAPAVSPPPVIANGFVTFGATNMLYKVSAAVLACWADILNSVPGSRLVIMTKGVEDEYGQSRIRKALFDAGVAQERIAFRGKSPMAEYLAAHADFDILLDTFPINGHTVTCNGLWMGVPVVTLAGQSYPERLGASVLSTIGLPELIARTGGEYVEKAVALAGDVARLVELRGTLRDRMQNSPLRDEGQFATDVEDAYRAMWHRFITQTAAK